jgi:hypothetical protein
MYKDPAVSYPVQQGIEYLDKRMPGWYLPDYEHPIDLDTLDMDSVRLCVLSQLQPGYDPSVQAPPYVQALKYLGISYHDAQKLGFDSMAVSFSVSTVLVKSLGAEWARVIRARRALTE